MFINYLLRSLTLDFKIWFFKKRIRKFRKTKDFKLITKMDLNTNWNCLLVSLAMIGLMLIILIGTGVIALLVALIIHLVIKAPGQTSSMVGLVVGILSLIGVFYVEYKKRKNILEERTESSLYLIIQYLIELKRGNYKYKIYKNDLSFIFMNSSNNVLIVLRDIQSNVKNLLKAKNEEDNQNYKNVIDKEILFLIVYIRESYNFSTPDLKYDLEHEHTIGDLIDNSSATKNKTIKNSPKINKLSKK